MGLWDKLSRAAEALAPRVEEALEVLQQKAEARKAELDRRLESAAFQQGRDDIQTAIVLSAPGRHEERAGRPAAGQTGKTLNRALAKLHEKDPANFPSASKDDYRIVNAVETVHYKKKTQRTEAKGSELHNKENQRRLRASLKDKKVVVALGSKASEALSGAGVDVTLKGSHPSMQNINRNFKAEASNPKARAEQRLSDYADNIRGSNSKATKSKGKKG